MFCEDKIKNDRTPAIIAINAALKNVAIIGNQISSEVDYSFIAKLIPNKEQSSCSRDCEQVKICFSPFASSRRSFPVDFTYRAVGISYRAEDPGRRTAPRGRGCVTPLHQSEYNA